MTGRRVDQMLSNSAVDGKAGSPQSAGLSALWGDALDALERRAPDLRVANLETSVTTSDEAWPGKRFHFRMHPRNTPCLTALGLDCCVLANNHVLDFGYDGLTETLESLEDHGLTGVGAGADGVAAAAPAAFDIGDGVRVLVFACVHPSSLTPRAWAAGPERPGVNLLSDYSDDAVERFRRQIEAVRRPRDVVLVSIHWGSNWGYEVRWRQRRFAHRLIDRAGVDIIHGHSSHHPMATEIHRGRPILYGCGDLINDYRPSGEAAPYRPELAALYFLRVDAATGRLTDLRLVPMQIRERRLHRASPQDVSWLGDALNRGGPTPDLATRIRRLRRLRRTAFRPGWQALNGELRLNLRR